jgi:hypothetical protein
MCFIENNIIPVFWTLGCEQVPTPEALDRGKQMVETVRLFSAPQQVAKRLVPEDMTESVPRLA